MSRATRIAGIFALCGIAGCGRHVMNEEPAVASFEIPAIQRAEELGREIYVQDLYAAQATSLLLAHGVDAVEVGALGWITESRPDGAVVTFVTGDSEQWRSACAVTFVDKEDPNIILIDKDLTETQSAMFNARQLALDSVEKACSDAYNTVVLPRDGESGWLAYALAATSDPNLILIGGHYRATVSADGRTVLDRRGFTRDCMVLKRPEDADPDADIAAYTLGHVLDNTPTEIHVFLNLLYGKPLYVVTADRRFWYVDGGKIRLLKRD
jgi:predicted DNA-binding transcriptional regulator